MIAVVLLINESESACMCPAGYPNCGSNGYCYYTFIWDTDECGTSCTRDYDESCACLATNNICYAYHCGSTCSNQPCSPPPPPPPRPPDACAVERVECESRCVGTTAVFSCQLSFGGIQAMCSCSYSSTSWSRPPPSPSYLDYNSPPPSPLPYQWNYDYYYNDDKTGIIVGSVVGGLLATLALIGGGIAFWCMKKRQKTRVAAAVTAPPDAVVVHTPVVGITVAKEANNKELNE